MILVLNQNPKAFSKLVFYKPGVSVSMLSMVVFCIGGSLKNEPFERVVLAFIAAVDNAKETTAKLVEMAVSFTASFRT